jgi:TRL (tRNA-associated locus)-like protein
MKTLRVVAALLAAGMLAGCATPFPQGLFYTDVKLPVNVTGNGGKAPKVGTAECSSFFALFATGDCSIESAKKQGGITRIHHVDWDAKNVLGIMGNYKLIVYGE